MEREVRYCTTEDGVTLAYGTLGSGPPLIIVSSFLSGLGYPGGVDSLYQLETDLARSLTVTRYDGRGMGLSDRTPDYSLEARLRDLAAVYQAIGAERASLLAGGWATFAAIAYAARYPERVDRLVLLGGSARGESAYETDLGRLADATAHVLADQWEFISETILARASPGLSGDRLKDRAAMFRGSWQPEDLLAFRAANRAMDVTAELSRIQAPTLVTYRASPASNLDHSKLMARTIPDARLFIGGPGGPDMLDRRTHNEIARFLGVDLTAPSRSQQAPAAGGVRTVLFTDLVGHTEMMQRLGDTRGRQVLRDHERITRDTLARHGGIEVKTDGDSFMASFASVTSAVDCAIALQRAFASREGEPLRVRIGLNAGEPVEDGGDLFGSSVILAARVKDQAGAGEILIPEPVRHLLAGKDFLFADRGEFLPKGFEDAVRLYEVRWRD